MSLKTETYIPLRYRKYFGRVVFQKGVFPVRYVASANMYIMPIHIARHIANLMRVQGKRIDPDDLIRGVYDTYVVYRDEDTAVLSITDKYGNMIGVVKLPVTVFKYYSSRRKPSIWL